MPTLEVTLWLLGAAGNVAYMVAPTQITRGLSIVMLAVPFIVGIISPDSFPSAGAYYFLLLSALAGGGVRELLEMRRNRRAAPSGVPVQQHRNP